jgi:hypothetical protein
LAAVATGDAPRAACKRLRDAIGEVDAKLAHDLDDLWVDALARCRARRERGVPAFGGALE